MKINKVNLSSVTTYRFGGICENFITIDKVEDIHEIPQNINKENSFILGKGSNIAFSDDVFKGYVLKTDLNFVNQFKEHIAISGNSSCWCPI